MCTPSQFIDEWINHEEWWFSSSNFFDAYITLHYEHLLNMDLSNEAPITKIIIYDQLPRHIFRNQYSNHIILYFLQKALVVDIDRNNLPATLWCFSLLPYRHTNDLQEITKVMKLAWKRLETETEKVIIKRFIKATYQRCPMDDQSKLIKYYQSNYKSLAEIKEEFADILDKNAYYLPQNTSANANLNNDKYILSLSGGVDSILCSKLFEDNYQSVVHINYCNRDTSDREEEFVKAFCAHIRKPLYVRRIEEINRPLCMMHNLRDIYESYTRNVRYSTYKTIAGKQNPKVILGHNKDDCLENIFTNIAHENHYENLNGMSEYSSQDGIVFVRPLLNFSKDQIRYIAYKKGYPFLPNSTPLWSQRGQIRSSIVPALETWDNRVVKGLFTLSETMKDLHSILDVFVDIYIKNTSVKLENGVVKYTIIFDNIPKIKMFWKVFLTKLCKNTPSSKSIDNLIFKLNSNISTMKIVLKRNMEVNFNGLFCCIICTP